MIEWNRPVRHIPDDELHAYLDQALSRSQAVEIERHLARCPRCQAARDAIAAMRDRTTDILAGLGAPAVILPPPYADLVARHAARETRRSGWARRSILAAGLAGMLFAGHNTWRTPTVAEPVPADPTTAAVPAAPPQDAPTALASSSTTSQPTQPAQPARPRVRPVPQAPPPQESRQLVRRAAVSEPPADGIANAIETDPGTWFAGMAVEPAPRAESWGEESVVNVVPVGNQDPGLAGLWRTVTPERGGAGVPLVPGAAILRMRMQPGDDGAEVVAVDQQLETGELIRTISGPAGRVAALVNEDGGREAAGRVTVTIRQADRMVAVTGPSDVLGSLLSRVNARRRY